PNYTHPPPTRQPLHATFLKALGKPLIHLHHTFSKDCKLVTLPCSLVSSSAKKTAEIAGFYQLLSDFMPIGE
ncbi:hypothetical protein, partial [Chitinivorax sp. B]|uniref:hypothetical protein n=1 Tax=Chitinivorax sp. B TaxID=2502235 RepID=UPI001BB1C019